MSPGQEETAASTAAAPKATSTVTDTQHGSTRPGRKRPSQQERVLAMLLADDGVCGSELYRAYLPRFGSSIHRLRKAGNVISKRPCDRPEHDHEGTAFLYRLNALPHDTDGP